MSASAHLDRLADTLERRVRTEQIRMLYAQAPLGAVTGLLIAPLLVAVLWNALPRMLLLSWLAALELSVLARLALAWAFQRRTETDALEPWARRYTWACATSGACWGGCALLLALSPSLAYEFFIILLLGGVLLGALLIMSASFSTYLAYAVLLSLPPTFWLIARGESMQQVIMGVSGLLYLLLALTTAWRLHRMITSSLRLAAENLSLAHAFAKAKEQAEDSNRQLDSQRVALCDNVDAMRQLYQVISIPRRHARDQIAALLAMGCQRFGLAIGILCHIEGQRYEVVYSTSPNEIIKRGDVLNLAETYCHNTFQTQTLVGFEHASAGPWRQHPCYHKFGLETYLGVPVRVGEAPYGVLSFSDFAPRATPFTLVDRELIQLMAQWIGGALAQERMAEAAQRQQALLAHASRLNTLGEMASGLVHEINQPITAITLYAEAGLNGVQSNVPGTAAVQEALEKIIVQGARATAIVQRIRHFARQSQPHYLRVSINAVLDDLGDFLEMETRRHQVKLHYAIAADLPPVRADALQVQQVILNLVRNAMDAMRTGVEAPALAISARATAQEVCIAVRDCGPGLAPDALGHILHPFFTTKPDGLGLGLAISQSIAEAHGGRLWATANQGPGATFHFTLPIAHDGVVSKRPLAPLALDLS